MVIAILSMLPVHAALAVSSATLAPGVTPAETGLRAEALARIRLSFQLGAALQE